MSTPGRWYWFQCLGGCGWNGVRYRNAKKCPRCRKPLTRFRKARADEVGKIREGTTNG